MGARVCLRRHVAAHAGLRTLGRVLYRDLRVCAWHCIGAVPVVVHKPLIVAASVAIICTTFALTVGRAILGDMTAPVQETTAPRFLGLPPAPDCSSQKNHRMWARCMGVRYTQRSEDRVRQTR